LVGPAALAGAPRPLISAKPLKNHNKQKLARPVLSDGHPDGPGRSVAPRS